MIDGDVRAREKPGVGAHAGRQHDELGRRRLAVRQVDVKRRVGIPSLADALDLGAGEHLYAFGFAPAGQHAARGLVHHARHHARRDLDDRQIASARVQRLEHDRADEARADEHDRRALVGELQDFARVRQRPAGVDTRKVRAGKPRDDRRGAGRDQQPII